MSERRFVLADFTYLGRECCSRPYEAGRVYALPRAVAHAATKRGLVARERPSRWAAPGMFRPHEALTEAEVVEAEGELRALQRHALEMVNPKAES